MKCECGAQTIFLSHFAPTLSKARDWSHAVTETDIPARIDRDECTKCGHVRVSVYSVSGALVERRE
jgi:hypothetical protein